MHNPESGRENEKQNFSKTLKYQEITKYLPDYQTWC